jgi:Ca2+/Na+ antiporter
MTGRKRSDLWQGVSFLLGSLLFLAIGTAIGMITSFKSMAASGSPEIGITIAKISGFLFYPFLIIGIFYIIKGLLFRQRVSRDAI